MQTGRTNLAGVGLAARGFTLIELIAVAVVIGLLSVLAVPAVRLMGTQRASGAAGELARDMLYARQRAVATGTVSRVVFDVAGGAYSVLAENPASPGRAGAVTISDPGTGAAFVRRLGQNQAAGVALLSASFAGQAEVGFDRLGRPVQSSGALHTAAGAVTISGGWTVTVQPRTGLVQVSGGAP
jgi:prepilin-type N-terminal cleavage/methylation domain-containing protein